MNLLFFFTIVHHKLVWEPPFDFYTCCTTTISLLLPFLSSLLNSFSPTDLGLQIAVLRAVIIDTVGLCPLNTHRLYLRRFSSCLQVVEFHYKFYQGKLWWEDFVEPNNNREQVYASLSMERNLSGYSTGVMEKILL